MPDLVVYADDGTERIEQVNLMPDIYRYRTLALMSEVKNDSISDSDENKNINVIFFLSVKSTERGVIDPSRGSSY
jgi:hypothetical protein